MQFETEIQSAYGRLMQVHVLLAKDAVENSFRQSFIDIGKAPDHSREQSQALARGIERNAMNLRQFVYREKLNIGLNQMGEKDQVIPFPSGQLSQQPFLRERRRILCQVGDNFPQWISDALRTSPAFEESNDLGRLSVPTPRNDPEE